MKRTIVVLLTLMSFHSFATLPSYESTDNQSMTKGERFDSIEKQMMAISNAVNSFEKTLNENAKKIKDLENIIKTLKDQDNIKAKERVGEQPDDSKKTTDEMKKLKADMLSIKNQDIEKIKVDIHDINDAIKVLQRNLPK